MRKFWNAASWSYFSARVDRRLQRDRPHAEADDQPAQDRGPQIGQKEFQVGQRREQHEHDITLHLRLDQAG